MEGHSKWRKAKNESEDEQDRISALPDELIHRILKFLDTKSAVRTSVFSKRWKFIWTTLPFLTFKCNPRASPAKLTNFTHHVFNNRDHRSPIRNLKLAFLSTELTMRFIDYAISRNVDYLNVQFRADQIVHCKLSDFSSNSIRKLSVLIKIDDHLCKLDCWDLPALTTLHLKYSCGSRCFPELAVTCLPVLTTLCLKNWDLKLFSFSLPDLTTLVLSKCWLPKTFWNFPALKSLTLHDQIFQYPQYMGDILSGLVSLENLTLCFYKKFVHDYFLNCPHLLNLEIKTGYYVDHGIRYRKIDVLAPKLVNFTSVGIFSISFEDSKLDNVYLKLRGWIDDMNLPEEKLKEEYQRFGSMLSGLGSAKILNLELETIKALSSVSDFLVSSPSPFYDLKYVKLPHGCKEESLSSSLRSYLLGGSQTATILTKLPQDAFIPCTAAASVTAQNVVMEEPLATPTKVLADLENINESACTDTVDMGLQEGHVVQNSEVHDDRVIRNSGPPVGGTGNNRASSSEGKSDIGLWLGHEVKSEYVCLLHHIKNKYPETFEHFATKNKEFCTMKLNMLCTTVNNFTKISITEVDTEMISEYRDVFDGLQKFKFNISWLVGRLDYVEQLRFSHPLLPELHAIDCNIDDAKSKLQDLQFRIDETKTKLQNLQTLHAEKMQEIEKAFGTMGTELAVGGYIGDGLLPGPKY